MSNFNKAFRPNVAVPYNGDQSLGFNNNNFFNKNDFLDNNIHNNVLSECITEYSVIIDSKDRSPEVYPNPFQYCVKFGPLQLYNESDGVRIPHIEASPIINQIFKNIKYVRLDFAIMPLYYKTKIMEVEVMPDIIEEIRVIDINKKLPMYNYINLNIKDLGDVNSRSTNDLLSDSFATLYWKQNVSGTHYKSFIGGGMRIYPDHDLGHFQNMHIQFTDQYGHLLDCSEHFNHDLDSSFSCNCPREKKYDKPLRGLFSLNSPEFNVSMKELVEEMNQENISIHDPELPCFEHNIHHARNPIFQHHLRFTFGIVEANINKKTFH